MLNCLFTTMGSGSSPDPNIYYRTFYLQLHSNYIVEACFSAYGILDTVIHVCYYIFYYIDLMVM